MWRNAFFRDNLERERQILAEKIEKTLIVVDDQSLRQEIKSDTNWLYLYPLLATISLGTHQVCGASCYWPGNLVVLPIIGTLATAVGFAKYWQLGNKRERYSENVLNLQRRVSALASERAKEILSTCLMCSFEPGRDLFEAYVSIRKRTQGISSVGKTVERSVMEAIEG